MAIITFIDKMSGFTAPVLVTEADIRTAPMNEDHKKLALTHHRRLSAQLPGEFSVDQQSALERLARITLIFRDYSAYQTTLPATDDEDSTPTTIESMIVDILDACIPICGVSQPIRLPAPNSHPKEVKIRALVHQHNTFHNLVEDISRRARALSKVVPDRHTRVDMAEGIDWSVALKRPRSVEDNFRLRWTFEADELDKQEKIDRERILLEREEKWRVRDIENLERAKGLREKRGWEEDEKEMKERIRDEEEKEEWEEEGREKERKLRLPGKRADLRLRWPPAKEEGREGRRPGAG